MTLIPDEELRIQAALGGIAVQAYLTSLDHLISVFGQAIPPSGSTEPGEVVLMADLPVPPAQESGSADDPATPGQAGKGKQGAANLAQGAPPAPTASSTSHDSATATETEPAPDATIQRRMSPGQ
jgi:hypothetical protein